MRLLFGAVSRLCVHDVATCTSSKALSELNIASNYAEVSPNRRGGSFSFNEMSADPKSSTGKFSLPVPFTFDTNTLFRESDIGRFFIFTQPFGITSYGGFTFMSAGPHYVASFNTSIIQSCDRCSTKGMIRVSK